MIKEIKLAYAAVLLSVLSLFVIAITFLSSNIPMPLEPEKAADSQGLLDSQLATDLSSLKRFESQEDFKAYLEKGNAISSFMGGRGAGLDMAQERSLALPSAGIGSSAESQKNVASRYSETNVQVAGIDEPDIVKNDGSEIYFSSDRGELMPLAEPQIIDPERIGIAPPRSFAGATKLIQAFPPRDLNKNSEIEASGNLLLKDATLVILPNNANYFRRQSKVIGYDVSKKEEPQEKWTVEIKDKSQVAAARLYGDKIYLITKNFIDFERPCPFEPIKPMGSGLEVRCQDIYHPVAPVQTDITYSISVIDINNGQLLDSVSFTGSAGESIVYMSQDSIYVTYYFQGDLINYAFGFLKENPDLFSQSIISKLDKLRAYEISLDAKMAEFFNILEKHWSSLSSDEEMRVRNEIENRISAYHDKHKRELERTGIVRIGTKDLDIAAGGSIPGKPLNQFSLDEYQGNLRVATTTGSGWIGLGLGEGSAKSTNDIYILSSNLSQLGSIQDLGLEERIYSARFIEDKGYLVTFRQIDPFFVIDLSNPQKPEKKGELKIPGFSSYLHPINKDTIIGIGEESGKVKAALFDVHNPQTPRELATFRLDEFWSEASGNHHAFMVDKKHEIFFLPGSKGGYIFSYANDQLKLAKAVSEINARRALYIDNYLYVIADDRIVVLDEKNWERVNELEL